jgi:hypothetical protein
MLVGMVLIHKPIEAMPGDLLQYAVKHAILVQHGAGSFRVSNVGKTSKHRRIHAMHHVYKFKPDSRGTSPAMTENPIAALWFKPQ